MKKQSLIIICILAAGSLLGTVYAASTVITDSGITTTNLTVTGTCTGCGASEGDFTSYNTVLLNTTIVPLATADTVISSVYISNNGDVLSSGNQNNFLLKNNGTLIYTNATSINGFGKDISQSMTGKFQILTNDFSSLEIKVFKDQAFLQNLSIDFTQFSNPTNGGSIGIAISSDGKYIAVVGKDFGALNDRILVFEGS